MSMEAIPDTNVSKHDNSRDPRPSVVNMIVVKLFAVGHVSNVPVAHVAPRLRFLPLNALSGRVCVSASSGEMRVAERL